MAFTTSIIARTVHGNQRTVLARITADAETGTSATGLASIDHFVATAVSLATGNYKLSATAGTLTLSGLASGDAINVICYGR
jgi:hypothetical protein